MIFSGMWPIAALGDGYAMLMNHVQTAPRIELRHSNDPTHVVDIVVVDTPEFWVAANHYNGVYAFQGTASDEWAAGSSTLKKWTQVGGHLVAETIGTPDSFPGRVLPMYASPYTTTTNYAWLSSDGAAIAIVGIPHYDVLPAVDRTISVATIYSTVDGSELWSHVFNEDIENYGPYTYVDPDSFVLLSATRFFVANKSSNDLEVYESTGVVQSMTGGYSDFAGVDSHFMNIGNTGSIGYLRTSTEDELVDLYVNELQTDGLDIVWGRAEFRIETDWVSEHVHTYPYNNDIYDTVTAAQTASYDWSIIVSPNLTDAYNDEITHYYIDPSAGTFEISDPGILPGYRQFEMFPSGPYITWVVGRASSGGGTNRKIKIWSRQPLGPNYVRKPFAPENAATGLRTLRELGRREWNMWFTADGTQYGSDLLANGAYNQYYLGYDVSQFEYEFNRRMQALLFTAATNTWRTDLIEVDVINDIGSPVHFPGPWQAMYAISSEASLRGDGVHPLEFDRLTDAVRLKSAGRTLLAIVIDGSRSYEQTSGFDAWALDDADVPGIITVTKQINDKLISMGVDTDLIIIRSSGYDTHIATTVFDFDGTLISVGGDSHRYGDDEADWAPTPTHDPVIPAVTIYATSNENLDIAAVKTAWFNNPTEPANSLENDTAEALLEGIRHAIGTGSDDGEYVTRSMIVATDAIIKMPVDQFYPEYEWPDLPIVTKSFEPISIDIELTGTLYLVPERYVEGSTSMDITLSGWLIPVFQLPIGGVM